MTPVAERPNSTEYWLAMIWNSSTDSCENVWRAAFEMAEPPPVTSSLMSTPSSHSDLKASPKPPKEIESDWVLPSDTLGAAPGASSASSMNLRPVIGRSSTSCGVIEVPSAALVVSTSGAAAVTVTASCTVDSSSVNDIVTCAPRASARPVRS